VGALDSGAIGQCRWSLGACCPRRPKATDLPTSDRSPALLEPLYIPWSVWRIPTALGKLPLRLTRLRRIV